MSNVAPAVLLQCSVTEASPAPADSHPPLFALPSEYTKRASVSSMISKSSAAAFTTDGATKVMTQQKASSHDITSFLVFFICLNTSLLCRGYLYFCFPFKLTQLKSCISGQNMPLSYELLSYCIKLLQYCPYTFIYPFILFAILSFSPIINIFPYVLLLSLRRNNADCVLKNFCNRIHICHCSDCQFFL